MRVRSSLMTIGLCVLLVAGLGGCPSDIISGLPGIGTGDSDDTGDGADTEKSLHEKIFTEIVTGGFSGTDSCLQCHSDEGEDILQTGHWTWQGATQTIEGQDGQVHGKRTLLNSL